VVHLNEGNVAFNVLELARAERDRSGLSFAEAFEAVKP
jgi:glucan phosphorylase